VFTFVDVGVLFLRLRETVQKTSDNPLYRRSEYQHTVSALILLFTVSTLLSAAFLAHTTWVLTSYALGGVSVLLAGVITLLPPTWHPNTVSDTDSSRNHEHGYFESPGVPLLPLLGIACNTFMMGSLPLSSWLLCLLWITCGVGVYFVYGIHNSTLGHMEDVEGLRLVSIDDSESKAVYHSAAVSGMSPAAAHSRLVGERESLLSPSAGERARSSC
jgi:hypothetical protein